MATMKQIFGNMKKGLSTGNFTLNGLVQTLQHYCEDLENSTGGGGGGSTVSYTQTATSGGECGTIDIDGNATKIYAPLQNAAGVGYDNTSSGLTADDVQEAIDELNTKEGDLSDLTTTAKTSLVAAINEAAQSGGGSLVDGILKRDSSDGSIKYYNSTSQTWITLAYDITLTYDRDVVGNSVAVLNGQTYTYANDTINIPSIINLRYTGGGAWSCTPLYNGTWSAPSASPSSGICTAGTPFTLSYGGGSGIVTALINLSGI